MAEAGEELSNNISLQKEELEALRAIYGEDFRLEHDYDEDFSEDKDKTRSEDTGLSIFPTFSISIPLGSDEDEDQILKKDMAGFEEARLIVSFQPGYPTCGPPTYQLSIPWLRGGQKQVVAQALEDLYLENLGENIVYLWVEKLREVLRDQLHARRSTVKNDGESRGSENTAKVDLSASRSGATTPSSMVSDLSSGKKEELIDCFSRSLALLSRGYDGAGIETKNDLYEGEESFYKHNQAQQYHQPNTSVPKMEIRTGAPLTDRKSTFQAHVAPITEVSEVGLVLEELCQNKKIAAATHNMYAYRILKSDSKTWLQDCNDDGETHAGSRLLHLLQILDCRNVLVVVSRWYGGIQLHADRFKHINNVARQALSEFGFLSETDGKKVDDPRNKKAPSMNKR